MSFMTSGPVVVQVLEGDDAVPRYRAVMGATNPAEADEGTIRKQFAESIEANSVHGSDSDENAAIEIAHFFGDDLAITLDMALRPFPPLFRWLKQAGNLSDFEMARTFNCGIGMLITVRADAADSVEKAMLMTGEDVWQIGQIGARSDDAVTLLNCSSAWA